MEGVASEAAALADHLKLKKLIYLYDNNHRNSFHQEAAN
jgi:transketolase